MNDDFISRWWLLTMNHHQPATNHHHYISLLTIIITNHESSTTNVWQLSPAGSDQRSGRLLGKATTLRAVALSASRDASSESCRSSANLGACRDRRGPPRTPSWTRRWIMGAMMGPDALALMGHDGGPCERNVGTAWVKPTISSWWFMVDDWWLMLLMIHDGWRMLTGASWWIIVADG